MREIKFNYLNQNYFIFCKLPLELDDIKSRIRQKIKNLKQFDLIDNYSNIIDENYDLNWYNSGSKFGQFTIVKK